MGRREDLGRHHTIRRTADTPPNKNNRRMLFFTLAMALVVYAMIKTGSIGPRKPPELSPPPEPVLPSSVAAHPAPSDLQVVIDLLAQGNWGPELSDRIELLSQVQWLESEQVAADYLALLMAGKSPDSASEQLLRGLAVYLGAADAPQKVSDNELVLYRVALATVSTHKQASASPPSAAPSSAP